MNKLLLILFFGSGFLLFSQSKETVKLELVNFSDKAYNDCAPSLYKDGILFVSDRDEKSRPFTKLYFSDFKSPPRNIKVKVQKYHVGPAFYDIATDIIYLTQSSLGKPRLGRLRIGVYQGKIKDDEITKLKRLKLCGLDNSYAYAQIRNNSLLIYTDENNTNSLIEYKLKGKRWIKNKVIFTDNYPILYPSYKDDLTIIFASKREGGMGGMDLYKIIKNNGIWSSPINLKEFNSEYDEHSLLYINEKEGYLSSNRIDNKEHIFKFTIN